MKEEHERLDNELDGLLDRALVSYTPYEPRPGLEGRILIPAGEACSRPARSMREKWALAAFALLVLIGMVSLWFKSKRLELAIVHRQAIHVEARSTRSFVAPSESAGSMRRVSGAFSGSEVRHAALRTLAGLESAHVWTTSGPNDADESLAFAPIVIKPIVIAPIRIGTED